MEIYNPLILAIDDNKDNLTVLKAIINDAFPKSEVLIIQSPKGGIEIAVTKNPDVILLDIIMPGLNGYETCRVLKENKKTNHIPVVFLTALKTDREVRLKALEAGAEAFLTKPIDGIELIAQIKAMVKIKKANEDKKNEREHLACLVADRTSELQKELVKRKKVEEDLILSYKKLQDTLKSAIETIAAICEIKDPYTAGHQVNVSKIAEEIAKELNFSMHEIENIEIGGILHDIGKIYIPTSILVKPGKLTENEFALIKQHSQIGYDIIKKMIISPIIATIVLQHHERLDGSGYPNGLKGSEIVMESRIMAVADVVEAMASHRPYRPAIGIEAALEEISQNSGILYDADVTDACLKVFRVNKFTLSRN